MSTQLPETFEPESQEGNIWDLVPEGEYVAQIVEAAVEQPKSMNGYQLTLVWKILEGAFENRQVWQRVTYLHSSQQAQAIGRKRLKDLCNALAINEHVEDVAVFLFKPARIRVGIERDRDGVYDDKNKIKRISPVNPQQAVPAAAADPKAAPQAEAARPQPATPKEPARSGPAGTMPWHQQPR
jgi:hypothetical protein